MKKKTNKKKGRKREEERKKSKIHILQISKKNNNQPNKQTRSQRKHKETKPRFASFRLKSHKKKKQIFFFPCTHAIAIKNILRNNCNHNNV